MGMSFHWVPARNGRTAQEELNTSLRSLRVVSVEKHFCPLAPDPGWAICVEYADSGPTTAPGGASSAKRVDYREVLDPETFTIFAALRELRKQIAGEEGNSHFADRGCVRSTSRSAWIRRTAWCGAEVLRLIVTTQPRSGS